MLKKVAAAAVLAGAAGGFLLTASAAAQAATDPWPGGGSSVSQHQPSNFQVLPVQICRGIDVLAIRNLLSQSDESGACVNGPANSQIAH